MSPTLLPEHPSAHGGRLGRHVEHDPRSRQYDVEAVSRETVHPVLWKRYSKILNQGDIGSCTGNAMAGWLGCAPHVGDSGSATEFDEHFAVKLYASATFLDRIPGEYPPDDTGSTGLAVAKAARGMGLIRSYSHAFTVNGLLLALQHGPVIVGVSWFDSFDKPDSGGYVEISPNAQVRGGHEFLIRGWDGQYLLADNSWGDWGDHGSFHFSLDTWDQLRSQQADVTVPRL